MLKVLALLWSTKNELTTRRDILDIIGDGNIAVYDSQVTDHMSKLIKAFQEIGFKNKTIKNDIIETVNKAKGQEGGYIFHDNLVTLDFD
jgi:DNA-binding winged helix-turn-helix (wHTH) protein